MKYPIIYVEWLDSQVPVYGWVYESELEPDRKLLKIKTCGFLFKKTKKVYTISSCVSTTKGGEFERQINLTIDIPACSIVKEKILMK